MQKCKCYDCMEYNQISKQKRMDYIAIEHTIYPDEDMLIKPRKKGKRSRKDKVKKTRSGCPENNYGPHIYLWVPYMWEYTGVVRKGTWFERYEEKVCCGCEKRARVKSFRRKP